MRVPLGMKQEALEEPNRSRPLECMIYFLRGVCYNMSMSENRIKIGFKDCDGREICEGDKAKMKDIFGSVWDGFIMAIDPPSMLETTVTMNGGIQYGFWNSDQKYCVWITTRDVAKNLKVVDNDEL